MASILAIVALLGAVACSAQEGPRSRSETPLTAELVKTGLYLISGGGGNSLLRLSANGLILVDGKRPDNDEELLAEVKRISDQPIRIRMSTEVRANEDDYTVRIGGIEVQSMHFGNAHKVVYFPKLRVVAVGDLFISTPDPDFLAGGSLVDWGSALDQILKLDFDVVVPAVGPTVSRAGLEAFKTKIDTLAELSRTK